MLMYRLVYSIVSNQFIYITMKRVKYDKFGHVEYDTNYDLNDCSTDELCQLVSMGAMKISELFMDGENEKAGYHMLVVENYQQELKKRLIYSAI